jgi:hypothetical protein
MNGIHIQITSINNTTDIEKERAEDNTLKKLIMESNTHIKRNLTKRIKEATKLIRQMTLN